MAKEVSGMKRETAWRFFAGRGQHCRIGMHLLALRSAVTVSFHSSYRIPTDLTGFPQAGLYAYHYLHDNHAWIVSSNSLFIPRKHQYTC